MQRHELAQALTDILQELDAGYAPSRQLIQQQIDALPAQEQAQEQGLQGQQTQAFNDITNGARDKGIGFSGIPLSEQAKYTAGTFLPAVANLKTSVNNQKTSLLGSLNDSSQDQLKTALGLQSTQQAQDFQQQQADRAAAAAAASNNSLASLFGGGQSAPAAADPYAAVDKQGAANAIVNLLKTNNVGTLANTISAIKASANNGNLYDKYKLELLGQYGTASPYAPLISKAMTFKPAVANAPIPVLASPSQARITF